MGVKEGPDQTSEAGGSREDVESGGQEEKEPQEGESGKKVPRAAQDSENMKKETFH